MLKNHLLITLRSLKRDRGYAFLNIAGLALGLVCCLLILLFVHDELRFDRFHTKADRIYRVIQTKPDQGTIRAAEEMSPLLASVFAEELPEVEHIVRFLPRPASLISREESRVRAYEDHFIYADSNFFEVFSVPLVQGDPATALDRPLTLVLTETAARTYFGEENPIGQLLLYNNTHPFEVTGVAADLPAHSSLHFDFLASFSTLRRLPEEAPMYNSGWGVTAYPTYVLLRQDTPPASVEKKIPGLLKRHTDAEHVLTPRYGLERLVDIHLYAKAGNRLGPQSDIRYVYIFSAIALLILLIACINYMNMATARSADRAREVGVRKVVGASWGQLARQFLGESMVMSMLAMMLALGLVGLLLPAFGALLQRDLSTDVFARPESWLLLLGVVVVVGLVSGSYPALLLSRLVPVDVLKGKRSRSSSGAAFRKVLVVFQFSISVALIASTIIIQGQLDHVRTKRLGLNPEQVLVLPLQASPVGQTTPIAQQPETFRAQLRTLSAVQAVAFSSAVPTRGASRFGYRREENEPWEYVSLYQVDPSFLATLGIETIQGDPFSEGSPATDVFINEVAMRLFGWEHAEAAVGHPLPMRVGRDEMTVRGVVRDFHFESLHTAIAPVIVRPIGTRRARYAVARVNPVDLQRTLQEVEAIWQQFFSDYPFDYFFLDDAFGQLYQAEDQLARIFSAFTLMAILIACLGLYGLAAFTAEQRTKEIGIRKVLGASIADIVTLLSKDFLKLVLVAFVVAAPVAYVAMQRWLEVFAYRMEMGWEIFALAGTLALVISLATVSYQAIRAALADPVRSLRYE